MEITFSSSYQDKAIKLSDAEMGKLADLILKRGNETAEKLVIVHRKSVQQILVYAISICNVVTGRLRAAFTPLLDKWGLGYTYQSVIDAPAPGQPGEPELDRNAIQQGKIQGHFIDEPLRSVIINNVAYAIYVDQKTGLMARIIVRGQQIYDGNFRNFFKALGEQDGIPPSVDPGEQGPLA